MDRRKNLTCNNFIYYLNISWVTAIVNSLGFCVRMIVHVQLFPYCLHLQFRPAVSQLLHMPFYTFS